MRGWLENKMIPLAARAAAASHLLEVRYIPYKQLSSPNSVV